jgi:hypothetical protein
VQPEATEPAVPPAVPVIHVPERDLGLNGDRPEPPDAEAPELSAASAEEGEPTAAPRKRTRRGTRGGRGRKRKPAAAATATADGVQAVEEAPPEEAPSTNGSGGWEYTPMSEWGDE